MLASQLAARAGAAASLLHQAGARRGRPLAAVTASAPALGVLAHAAAALGCPLFPMDPALPADVIDDLLAQAGAQLTVGTRGVLSARDILAAGDGPVPASSLRPQDIALLVATSGTSGRPKAVMLTAANLRTAALASAACAPLGPGDRWLACLPLFHIGGYSILGRCALAGAEAAIEQGFDAQRIVAALAAERITHVSLVPAMLTQLMDVAASPPPSLRHVLVGGAALSAVLAERAAAHGWPIQPTYGMSETASQLATLPALPRPWRQGLVGRPLPGLQAALTEDGRLKVRGAMVMAGYANPRLAPGDGLEDGWFVTSDLAEILADGSLVILGRADDVIVSGGKKVQPAMVENELAGCPDIDALAVVGRPDGVWGQLVTVVYAGTATPEALLDWCRKHVAGARRPRAAIRVAALPRLASGKPDRSALRRLAEGHHAEPGPAAEHEAAADQRR